LAVLARPGPAADVQVIDTDRPAVYCLPGRHRIVLTSGALSCLDDGQLEAVLAHERAHMSERHHLLLRLAAALESAFPVIRFFGMADPSAPSAAAAAGVSAARASSAPAILSRGRPWWRPRPPEARRA